MKKIRTNFRTVSTLLSLNLFLASCSSGIDNALDNLGDATNKKTENTSSNIMSRDVQKYSGEELFQSIFFAYGDFSKNISMHQDIIAKIEVAPTEQKQAFIKRFNNFANNIKTKNPSYFENFKRDILSGDNTTIQNAIGTGSISIYENIGVIMPEIQPVLDKLEQDEQLESIVASGEISQQDFDSLNEKYQKFLSENYQMQPEGCSWAVACVIYAALAIHNTVALTANIAAAGAIAVYLGVKWWGPKLTSPKQSGAGPGPIPKVKYDEDLLKFEIFIQEIADASRL